MHTEGLVAEVADSNLAVDMQLAEDSLAADILAADNLAVGILVADILAAEHNPDSVAGTAAVELVRVEQWLNSLFVAYFLFYTPSLSVRQFQSNLRNYIKRGPVFRPSPFGAN